MSQLKIKPKGKKKEAKALALPVIREDAAGIDIGATLIHVAVGPGRDEEPVRTFQTFTRDLKAIAVWLRTVGVKTVAMESTGVYWIPLYELLESEGFEVLLVNAHHVKRVPGRKTDVSDAQWLQYLHSVGLLQGSFRPNEAICAIRSIEDTYCFGIRSEHVALPNGTTSGIVGASSLGLYPDDAEGADPDESTIAQCDQ